MAYLMGPAEIGLAVISRWISDVPSELVLISEVRPSSPHAQCSQGWPTSHTSDPRPKSAARPARRASENDPDRHLVVRGVGCPAGIKAPSFVRELKSFQYAEAVGGQEVA